MSLPAPGPFGRAFIVLEIVLPSPDIRPGGACSGFELRRRHFAKVPLWPLGVHCKKQLFFP